MLYDALLGPSTGSGRTVKTPPSVRGELVEPHFEMGSRPIGLVPGFAEIPMTWAEVPL